MLRADNVSFAYGGRLLAWGQDPHVNDQGQLVTVGRGLRLIDPRTGTILQEGLPGPVRQRLVPLMALSRVALGGRQHGQEG